MEQTGKYTTHLKATTIIHVPSDLVWQVLTEYGNISAFHPMVKKSFSTNSKIGLGATRHCDLQPMGEMEEEITAWEEGRLLVSEVKGGKLLPPYRFMRGKTVVESLGGETRVSFTFSYLLKFGLIGRVMNKFMIKPQFSKAPPQYLQGLKKYLESGEIHHS